MSLSSAAAPAESSAGSSASSGDEPLSPAAIDLSCRWPVLLLIFSGLSWLALGLVLSLITSIKLHVPGFLADTSWLTLGRVRPAAMNSLLYGFACQVGLGVALWMTCRLGGVTLLFRWLAVVGWKFWNIGVTVGVLAILAGASCGFEWLEMPRYAAGILFIAYALLGLAIVATFALRRTSDLFPSQWYLLAALFWFPWIYSAANYLLLIDPVRGTFQSAINAWFTGNFIGLWLGPIALAAIFYFIPRLTGQPLYSRELALFGFWTMTFFTGFSGLAALTGGPVPRWMSGLGTAASVCLFVPLVCHGINWHLTNAGSGDAWKQALPLRFILFGAAAYLLEGVVGVFVSLPQVSAVTGLTYVGVARTNLALHGFIAMVLFGSLYYIVPRLTQVNWPSTKAIRVHLFCSISGVALIFLPLAAGGVLQGLRMANPEIQFIQIVRGTIPFVGMSTLGVLLLLIGLGAFLINLVRLLRIFLEPIGHAFCAEWCGRVPTKAEVRS